MNTRGFLLSWLVLAGLTHAHARAAGLTESFDSRADLVSGTAVWNQALGVVHPTLRLNDYDINPSPPPIALNVGDGSDGVFDNTTYASFSVAGDVSGNIIRLDTDVHQVLQVTKFVLDSGWKIIPQGTHPLIIKSLSSVQILGEIHCEGVDGGNSVGASIGTGGTGRCGGKNGGDGGLATQAGVNGTDADALVTGGTGGVDFGGTAAGGGGGGSWNSNAATDGPGSGVSNGGQKGTSFSDPEFSIVKGGAGGGGGAGDATTAGGGGGGGGGVVIILAVGNIDIGAAPSSTTGFIYAHGGRGGSASGGGGPGGGGGGGSVEIFTAGALNLYNTDVNGASQATGGASGTNASAAVGALGGMGRSWTATSSFFFGGTGFYNPTEEGPATVGRVDFEPSAQSVITKIFDRGTLLLPIASLSLSPTSGNFKFEVAGSNDDFVADDTGFTTDSSVVAGKRYLKMRLTITTLNASDPVMIDTATVTYASLPSTLTAMQDDFKFKAAGCGRVEDGGSRSGPLALLTAPIVMLLILRRRASSSGLN